MVKSKKSFIDKIKSTIFTDDLPIGRFNQHFPGPVLEWDVRWFVRDKEPEFPIFRGSTELIFKALEYKEIGFDQECVEVTKWDISEGERQGDWDICPKTSDLIEKTIQKEMKSAWKKMRSHQGIGLIVHDSHFFDMNDSENNWIIYNPIMVDGGIDKFELALENIPVDIGDGSMRIDMNMSILNDDPDVDSEPGMN